MSKFRQVVTGVLGLVVNPAGQVLFVRQNSGPYAGEWLIPGGSVEMGEPAAAAAVREIREETGITMANARCFAVYELRGRWAEGPYHLYLLAFRGDGEGEIPPGFQGDNVGGVCWAYPADLPLHPTDLRILNDAGVTAFPETEVAAALAAAGIEMTRFPGPVD